MNSRRIILFAFAPLLLFSSSVFALQVSKRTVSVPSKPSVIQVPKVIARPVPAHAFSQGTAPLHINFPRQRSGNRKPRVTRFTFGKGSTSIIRAHQTSVSANGGSVSLTLDIGQPQVSNSNALVKNAPAGMTFSQLRWPVFSSPLPSGLTLISPEGGWPDYPILTVTLAIPAGATDITPTVSITHTSPVGKIHFLPSVREVKDSLVRSYDPKLYSIEPKVTILKPEMFRSLRMVTVSVPLIHGSDAFQSFTVGIRYTTRGVPAQGTVRDPLFLDMDRRLVANPYDVGRFAVPLRQARAKPKLAAGKGLRALSAPVGFDSVYTWINPNAEYVRLAVTRDGLYRVAASDLTFSKIGFSPASAGWTPQNLRCISHGKEIPIWIDTDAAGNIASIEFYGQHLRGFLLPTDTDPPFNTERRLPEYFNLATDTNVYWLTSDSSKAQSQPLRYSLRSPSASGVPILTTGAVLLHHERDLNYYQGDAIAAATETLERTEYVAGERFEWFNFDGRSNDSSVRQMFDTFYIAKLPADTAGQIALLKFRLRGTTEDQNTAYNPHRAEIFVNGKLEGDDVFFNFNYDSLQVRVPLSDVVTGPNVLRVFAGTSGAQSIDQWYLDYYEVSFPSGLVPSIDTGIAKGQWFFSESPGSRTFQLALSDPTAHLYNLTDGTRIASQPAGFIDSIVNPNPQYAAATSASLLRCANIRPWNVPNSLGWSILNAGHTADYIIITDDTFIRAANELAARRSGQGLKPLVVTTDEVFNAFDYGSNEPEAIRRFLNYAYLNYSGVPAGFVTLLGNASFDPKFNLAGSTKRSFVPTYGNPVSDFYFTLAEDSGLDSQPLMLISRIPAATESDAENYINKLVEYEDEPPAPWNRNFLFLAGGDKEAGQHDLFHAQEQAYLSLLSPPPANVMGSIIDRTDFGSGVDATHVGEIQDALQSGRAIMYFGGHGATFTSDILFPQASNLHNKGLYPLLITLTCRTGAFAEPDQIGINESYIDAINAGSVQAYGTTGFGEQDLDDLITGKYFQLMQTFDSTSDTTRPETMNSLALLTAAKLYATPFSYYGHNEGLQLSMLGDAATGFVLRPQPEFAVYSNEVHAYAGSDSIPRNSLSVSDSIMTIRALIHNYGFAADRPVVVRFTDAGPRGLPFVINDTMPRLDTSAIVSANFPLSEQSVGSHNISVVIDPDHRFPESYRPDDSASIQVLVNGLSTTAFYPYEGSRDFCDVGPSSVHFIVLTPSGSSAGDQVELELDTTQKFSNILADRKASIGSSYYVTFDVSIPSVPVPYSTVYWWRSRVVRANGDTTDWQYATFSTGSAPRSEFSYTSREQDSSLIVSGLSLDSRGMLFLPAHDTVQLEAIAHGVNDIGSPYTPFGEIRINGQAIPPDITPPKLGFTTYAIVVMSVDGSQIENVNAFDLDWNNLGIQAFEDSAATVFDSVIDVIPTGRRVIVLGISQPQFPYFIDSTRGHLQELGSLNGMQGVDHSGSYAMIGMKGGNSGTAKEAFAANGSAGAKAFDTIVTAGTTGLATTPFTAVAKDYGSLTWAGDPVPAGSDITFSVLGARRDGTGTDVVGTFNASNGQSFSLSNIDPRTYDRLGVRMNFIRTSNATQSPALSGIQLQYDAAPELFFTTDSIVTSPKLTNSGAIVTANYTVSTLTCTQADSVPLILTRQYQSKTDTVATHLITALAGHASLSFSDSLQTVNELGNVGLMSTVNPNETINEQLLFNNSIAGNYTVTRDTTKPTINILFDNRNIPNGGYVSSNATIEIQLLSSNPLRDTVAGSIVAASLVNITGASQQNYFIGYYNHSGFPQPDFESYKTGPIQAFLRFKPSSPYPPGTWLLTAAVTDASGNTDTLQQQFTISSTNGLDHVMNYPNPFKDKTDFTFVLRSNQPADVKIIVYTIAGRKVRTLTPVETHAGFNAVEWDGRDERGNDVANGTYLYRVIINGKNGDNVSDAMTERAVRDR